jgi:hypothetical protein
LEALEGIGAITVESVTRRQQYKNSSVNGSENEPFNGAKIDRQRGGNCTDSDASETLIKVGLEGLRGREGQRVKKCRPSTYI